MILVPIYNYKVKNDVILNTSVGQSASCQNPPDSLSRQLYSQKLSGGGGGGMPPDPLARRPCFTHCLFHMCQFTIWQPGDYQLSLHTVDREIFRSYKHSSVKFLHCFIFVTSAYRKCSFIPIIRC